MDIRKKLHTTILFVIILSVLFLLLWQFLLNKNNYIVISNTTDTTLSDLSINYIYADKENKIKVPEIKAEGNYKLKLVLPDGFSEGAVKLNYTDKQGVEREEYLAGYIEKGYEDNIIVKISSVDINGILSLQVQ